MSPKTLVAVVAAAAFAGIAAAPAAAQDHDHSNQQGVETLIAAPQSISAEHHEIHELLERATRESGSLGQTARNLEGVLAPHFKREEEIATPPLGLLPALATGEPTAEMRAVLPMTTALESELPQMLREHEAIVAALGKFREAAVAADRAEYIGFADTLAAHARQEEEILYPAAILVGRYIGRLAPKK